MTEKVLTFDHRGFRLITDGSDRSVNPQAAAKFKAFADKRALRVIEKAILKLYEVPSLPPLPYILDPHQIEGVKWILSRSRSYLAHPPGAGKTLQAILAAEMSMGFNVRENKAQTLIVCPPNLTMNWEREIKIWTFFENRISSVGPTSQKAQVGWDSRYVIVPDSMLAKSWVQEEILKREGNWVFCAVDEASRFKEPFSQRTLALFGGQKDKDSPKYKGLKHLFKHMVLMDGTPMPNRPIELWAPTFALAPEVIDFKNYHDFGQRYCGATINSFGKWEYLHSSNEVELKEKLTSQFMHVVKEEDLNHPERKRSILYLSDDPRTQAQADWDWRLVARMTDKNIDEDLARGEMAVRRKEIGLQKVDWVAGFIKDRLKTKNESILVFGWHRQVCENLADKLSAGLVIGGVDPKEREKLFRKFQAGKERILVGNIQAMGIGHNLQRADLVIFIEPSWTDSLNTQAEKRAARKGRDENCPVRSLYMVMPNTMDEIVMRSNFRKFQTVKKIIG